MIKLLIYEASSGKISSVCCIAMMSLNTEMEMLPELLVVPEGAVRISREAAISSKDLDFKNFSLIPHEKKFSAMEAMSNLVSRCLPWPPCAFHGLTHFASWNVGQFL